MKIAASNQAAVEKRVSTCIKSIINIMILVSPQVSLQSQQEVHNLSGCVLGFVVYCSFSWDCRLIYYLLQFQRKKETIENEKAQLRIQESERKKEATKKLKKYEADSLKSRLIYEGLLSRTGQSVYTSMCRYVCMCTCVCNTMYVCVCVCTHCIYMIVPDI